MLTRTARRRPRRLEAVACAATDRRRSPSGEDRHRARRWARIGCRPPMRFFEYESREDRRQGGHPDLAARLRHLRGGGAAHRAGDRRAHRHQVAGAHRRPHEGRRREVRRHPRRGRHARRGDPRRSRSTATCRAACWWTRASPSKQEYYAGVTWDGTRKRPVMIFSADGRDRHRGGGRDAIRTRSAARTSRPSRPFADFEAKEVIASAGRHRQALNAADADHGPAGAAVLRVRHDAGGDQPAGGARGRHVRGRRRPHGHGERGPAAPEGAAARARRGRRGDPPGPRGDAVRARRRGRSTPRTTAAWPAT